jgi:ribosome-binding protein aMBF1 (putative translation factor)
MDGQDWTPVVVRSTAKKPTGGAGASGHKPARTPGAAAISHLEDDDYPKPTKSLSPESRADMIRARSAKSMTQDQLNTACSFPHNTINKIEKGLYCPTPEQMNVLRRVLNINMKYK